MPNNWGYDPERYRLKNVEATKRGGIVWNLVDRKTGRTVQKKEYPVIETMDTGDSPAQRDGALEDKKDELRDLTSQERDLYKYELETTPEMDPILLENYNRSLKGIGSPWNGVGTPPIIEVK